MKAGPASHVYSKDLGEWWHEVTGLPFVFAVWAARPGVDCSSLDILLSESRERGLANVNAIAEEHGTETT